MWNATQSLVWCGRGLGCDRARDQRLGQPAHTLTRSELNVIFSVEAWLKNGGPLDIKWKGVLFSLTPTSLTPFLPNFTLRLPWTEQVSADTRPFCHDIGIWSQPSTGWNLILWVSINFYFDSEKYTMIKYNLVNQWFWKTAQWYGKEWNCIFSM